MMPISLAQHQGNGWSFWVETPAHRAGGRRLMMVADLHLPRAVHVSGHRAGCGARHKASTRDRRLRVCLQQPVIRMYDDWRALAATKDVQIADPAAQLPDADAAVRMFGDAGFTDIEVNSLGTAASVRDAFALRMPVGYQAPVDSAAPASRGRRSMCTVAMLEHPRAWRRWSVADTTRHVLMPRSGRVFSPMMHVP